jgi:hypothetical protein
MASTSRRALALLLLAGALFTGATATAQAAPATAGRAAHPATAAAAVIAPCPQLISIKDTSWGDRYCPPTVLM